MSKNYIQRVLVVLAAVLLLNGSAFGAGLTGTKSIPTDYPDLATAINALNTNGVGAGGVTIMLTANQSLSAGLVIGSATLNATCSSFTPIVIDGGGNTITANFAGTNAGNNLYAAPGVAVNLGTNDAAVIVKGVDYLTIKNCVFAEQATNLINLTKIENALAFYNLNSGSPYDGCQHINITGNTFGMSRDSAGASIFVCAGTFGSIIKNAWGAYTAATAPDYHRDFNISGNTFGNVAGTTDAFNKIIILGAANGSLTMDARNFSITNNTFNNIGGAVVSGGCPVVGVYAQYVDTLVVDDNSLTVSSVYNGTGGCAAISASILSGTTLCSGTIEMLRNTIKLQTNTNTGTCYGVIVTTNGQTTNVNNNILQFGSFLSTSSSAITGFRVYYNGSNVKPGVINTNNNSCTGQSLPNTNGAFMFIDNQNYGGAGNGNVTANYNTFQNCSKATNAGFITIINLSCPVQNDSAWAANNLIDNFTGTNNTASAYNGFKGIALGTNSWYAKINNNIVSNIKLNGSVTVAPGLYVVIKALDITLNSNANANAFIYNNQIHDLSYPSNNSNSGSITGIITATGYNWNIYQNNIYNLDASGTGYATNTVTGIAHSGAPYLFEYNNFISGLTAANSSDVNAVKGIDITTTSVANIAYNTIYFSSNTPVVSSKSTFGGAGIYLGNTSGIYTVKNNIINGNGTAAGDAYFAAIKRIAGSYGAMTLANNIYSSTYIFGMGTALSTATQLYYAAASGLSGTADPAFNTSCGKFKLAYNDKSSFTENNLSQIGATNTYIPSGASYAQGGAKIDTASKYNNDFSLATRSTTFPDMGALEFSGTALDAVGPTISYASIPDPLCATAPSLSVTITDISGVDVTAANKPRLYYKKSSDNDFTLANWKYVTTTSTTSPFNFTLDYSKLATGSATFGDVIQYFVAAQDLAGTANVSATNATFTTYCPSSVVLSSGVPISGTSSFKIAGTPTILTKAFTTAKCIGALDTLTTVMSSVSSAKIGTGLTATNNFSPYASTTLQTLRNQYLYTAAELKAAGFVNGNITALALTILSLPTAKTLNGMTIKMGSTNLSALTISATAVTTSQVYTIASYPLSVGVNTHTLDVPFAWDGVSNVVVDICFSNYPSANSTETVEYTPMAVYLANNKFITGLTACANTSQVIGYNRPNIIFTGKRILNDNFSSFVWKTNGAVVGNNNDTIFVTPTFPSGSAQTYYMSATDNFGCTFKDTVNIVTDATCINTWTGASSTAWTDSANWTLKRVPSSCNTKVVVNPATNNPIVSGADAQVGKLTLNSNSNVTIVSPNVLNVCDSLIGGATAAGNTIGGKLVMDGTTAQVIDKNLNLSDLVIANTGATTTIQSTGNISISNSLVMKQGALTNNGSITLTSSSPTQAAYFDNFTNAGTAGTFTTSSGTFTLERALPTVRAGYTGIVNNVQHYLSSPMNGLDIAAQWNELDLTANTTRYGGTNGTFLVPSNNCSFDSISWSSAYGNVFEWVESNGSAGKCVQENWKIRTTGTIVNGTGLSAVYNYIAKVTSAGTPNLTNVSVPLSYTSTGLYPKLYPTVYPGGSGINCLAGWNLVGNPFPSPYKWTNGGLAGIDGVAYVWQATGTLQGTYQPIANGVGEIASHQGFFVHANMTGQTLVFDKANRVASGTTQFYKTTNMNLTLEVTGGVNNFHDKTYIMFNPNATSAFDNQYDGYKMFSNTGYPTMFSNLSNNMQSINVNKDVVSTPAVPVGLYAGSDGTFTITASEIATFDPTTYIYLEDKKVGGAWINLRATNSYTFTATNNDAADRFVVHFTPPLEITTADAVCNTKGSIKLVQPGTASWTYVVKDNAGNVASSGTVNATTPVNVPLNAGIYDVIVTDANGYSVTNTAQVNATSSSIAASFNASTTTANVYAPVTFDNTSANTGGTTYWNFGDGVSVSNVNNPTHNYTKPGTYTVVLTVTNALGCTSTSREVVTITNATGINNLASDAIDIFSNADKVYVDFTKSNVKEATIQMYNLLGQEISNEKHYGNGKYVHSVDLDAAFIIVRVRTEDGKMFSKKVFVSNK